MTKKRSVTLLLLFASILALMIPVFPHHHHFGAEDLCMHHDADPEESCEEAGCIASFFYQVLPETSIHLEPIQTVHFQDFDAVGTFGLITVELYFHKHTYFFNTADSLPEVFYGHVRPLRAPPCLG